MSDPETTQKADKPASPPSFLNDLPFPRKWLYYGLLKLVVIAIAVVLALKWQGLI